MIASRNNPSDLVPSGNNVSLFFPLSFFEYFKATATRLHLLGCKYLGISYAYPPAVRLNQGSSKLTIKRGEGAFYKAHLLKCTVLQLVALWGGYDE